MNIIQPSHQIVRCTEGGPTAIAEAARTCYLSEPKDSPELRFEFENEVIGWTDRGQRFRAWHMSEFEEWIRDKFITKLREMGHQTPFEFMDIEMVFICDRGVSHEAVRHRMCSPMQESTRYCNYNEDGKHGLSVIEPLFFNPSEPCEEHSLPVFSRLGTNTVTDSDNLSPVNKFHVWTMAMAHAEWAYNQLLKMGATPQEARSVLPNSLKTKLRIKANVREWWHIFNLRAINTGAHPQIREIMIPALKECAERWPVLFQWQLDKLKSDNPLDGKAKPKDGE